MAPKSEETTSKAAEGGSKEATAKENGAKKKEEQPKDRQLLRVNSRYWNMKEKVRQRNLLGEENRQNFGF